MQLLFGVTFGVITVLIALFFTLYLDNQPEGSGSASSILKFNRNQVITITAMLDEEPERGVNGVTTLGVTDSMAFKRKSFL